MYLFVTNFVNTDEWPLNSRDFTSISVLKTFSTILYVDKVLNLAYKLPTHRKIYSIFSFIHHQPMYGSLLKDPQTGGDHAFHVAPYLQNFRYWLMQMERFMYAFDLQPQCITKNSKCECYIIISIFFIKDNIDLLVSITKMLNMKA